MKKVTAQAAILKALKSKKTGATAKELVARLNFSEKTIRNNLGTLVNDGAVDYAEYLRTCKVSGNTVTAYTVV